MAEKNKSEDQARQEQFPALSGEEQIEIAKRSQDVEAAKSQVHEKVFVVLQEAYKARQGDDLENFHARNIAATRQYLMHQGLRPTEEEGRFVGAEDHEDGESVNLTYAVNVTPAVVAHDPEVAHARVIEPQNEDKVK